MKIGLYPGSFNPIHIGHLLIATFMAEEFELDKIWFIVSPHNPLKDSKTLANENDRLKMVQLSIKTKYNFLASDIEFNLPKPSYTIQTLDLLKTQFPSYNFLLIIGGDNLTSLNKWKDYNRIIDENQILVYNRADNISDKNFIEHKNIHFKKLPQLDISSTMIRERIKTEKSIDFMVTNEVKNYIIKQKLYK
jgi:nicotinate-nucleotide adenylyltransferase